MDWIANRIQVKSICRYYSLVFLSPWRKLRSHRKFFIVDYFSTNFKFSDIEIRTLKSVALSAYWDPLIFWFKKRKYKWIRYNHQYQQDPWWMARRCVTIIVITTCSPKGLRWRAHNTHTFIIYEVKLWILLLYTVLNFFSTVVILVHSRRRRLMLFRRIKNYKGGKNIQIYSERAKVYI